MWADTLLRAEQQHLLRLLAWAGGSIVAGTAVLLILAIRRRESLLLHRFALLTIVTGALVGAFAATAWSGLHLRDGMSAANFERMLWFRIGLEVGLLGVGATLALSTLFADRRRLGPVGAGIALSVQGIALAAIDLQLVSVFSR